MHYLTVSARREFKRSIARQPYFSVSWLTNAAVIHRLSWGWVIHFQIVTLTGLVAEDLSSLPTAGRMAQFLSAHGFLLRAP